MGLVAIPELKEFDAASLSGSYQAFGSTLSNAAYYAVIFNASNVAVYISTDGTNDHFRIPSGQCLPLTFFSRHNTLLSASALFKNGAQLYIKQVTGTGTGFISANILTKG